jgi:outer membrane protein TolC
MRSKILHIVALTIFLGSSSMAHAAPKIDMDSYLEQVKKNNPAYKASEQASEGAKLRATEGTLLILPRLEIDASKTVDEGASTNPTFMGDKNTSEKYSVGISQNTTFGLSGKIAYGHMYTFTENASPLNLPAEFQNGYHRASPSIELNQSLWKNGFGSEVRAQRSGINAAAEAAHYEERAKNLGVLIEAQGAYYKLYYMQKTVDAFKDSMTVAEKLKNWAKKRYDQALGEQSDYYQTKAAYELRELEYLNAQEDLKSAARAFNSMKGIESESVTENLVPPKNLEFNRKKFSEEIWRDDVRSASKQAEAAKAKSLLGKEKNRPTLDIFGNYAWTGLDADGTDAHNESMSDHHPVYTVGVKFAAPLAFTKASDVTSGYEEEAMAADLSFKRKAQEQERDYNDLLSKIENANLRLKLATTLEESQKIKVESERKRHMRGKTTFFQVLTFEQDYLTAQLTKIKAESELNTLLTQSQMYRGE